MAAAATGDSVMTVHDFDGSVGEFDKVWTIIHPPNPVMAICLPSVGESGLIGHRVMQLNTLDELMCSELQEEGKPELPSYGMGMLSSRCP